MRYVVRSSISHDRGYCRNAHRRQLIPRGCQAQRIIFRSCDLKLENIREIQEINEQKYPKHRRADINPFLLKFEVRVK